MFTAVSCRRGNWAHNVQQDLSAFFDSLSRFQSSMRLCVTLAHPALWLDLFPAFMRSSFACLWLRITPPRWRAAHVGLLQGCPSSPVLSLCVGHLWTEFVSSQQADTGIFVDDRVLWLPAPGSSAAHDAQQALQRSDQFDRAAGLTCSRRKCHLVTDDPDCSWRGLAHRHGNTIAPTLKFLGVELSLETGGILSFEAPLVLVGEVLGWPPEWSDEVTLDTLAAARMSGYPAADS
ncbi:unnamed protein product [Symbiodinium microadriaticum]|nr:unnamed protein product [Symbiodinium sp. KB8]CAE7498541.1 unnamed protein product [Symbiodinium microadriaticum]